MIALEPGEPAWLVDELADDVPCIGGRTQLEKVLNALAQGAETSTDINAMTGLSIKTCAAYLYKLNREGRVRRESGKRRYTEGGSGSHVYRLVQS